MKEVLAETKNVAAAKRTLSYLLSRPRSEMVGLGLIYGAPGLGKTRFAMRTAFKNGYIYLRIDATMTQRSFLAKLYTSLQYVYGVAGPVKGSKQKIYKDVVELLDAAPETVIMIDEIDYAFRDKALLGTIRDLVDETLVTIMLIGMQDAKASLLAANAHYFDRCNAFCEFQPLSLADTKLICTEASDIKMSDDVIQFVHKSTEGAVRNVVKSIDMVERIAREKGLKAVTMEAIQ